MFPNPWPGDGIGRAMRRFVRQTAAPTDDFAQSFTETIDGFRISVADEVVTSDLPDALQVLLVTEMLVRTMFDVLRDTRLEILSDSLAWGIVHAFRRVAGQLDGEADKAALKVRDLIHDAGGSEVMMGEIEEVQTLCQSLTSAKILYPINTPYPAGVAFKLRKWTIDPGPGVIPTPPC